MKKEEKKCFELIPKEEMNYIVGANGKDYYVGSLLVPFNLENLTKGYNVWEKENYKKVILNKVYPLYQSYTRKGIELIGVGELVGYICLFSGNAYRGMGALGCSFSRTKGVGIVLSKDTLMFQTLLEKGFEEKNKPIRFKGLTANTYVLKCKLDIKENPNWNTKSLVESSIVLVGNDETEKNLSIDWTKCITLDFK